MKNVRSLGVLSVTRQRGLARGMSSPVVKAQMPVDATRERPDAQGSGAAVERSEQPAAAESEDINPTCPFVQKLYAMLEEETVGGKRAEWVDPEDCTKRGWPLDAFTVSNNSLFQTEVLPKFYRHANFTR